MIAYTIFSVAPCMKGSFFTMLRLILDSKLVVVILFIPYFVVCEQHNSVPY